MLPLCRTTRRKLVQSSLPAPHLTAPFKLLQRLFLSINLELSSVLHLKHNLKLTKAKSKLQTTEGNSERLNTLTKTENEMDSISKKAYWVKFKIHLMKFLKLTSPKSLVTENVLRNDHKRVKAKTVLV